jgi:hypothetical protein
MISPDLSDVEVELYDLSPTIKQFAAEHEQEIKRRAIARMIAYYEISISTDHEAKWDKGCKEHGTFTNEKRLAVDWKEQERQEFDDTFWYETILYYNELVETEL